METNEMKLSERMLLWAEDGNYPPSRGSIENWAQMVAQMETMLSTVVHKSFIPGLEEVSTKTQG
jgi:hypothetical protein